MSSPAVNLWEVTDHIQALIRSRQPVEVNRLVDAGVPLEELAPREGIGV